MSGEEKILEFLIETVKSGYEQIKDIKKEILPKGARDIVTNCDLLIEKHIINQMKANYPNIEIISEEFNSKKDKKEEYFVIDPIDGTANFANGLDMWDIQVAYTKKGEIIASVMYMPELNVLITSLNGKGTFTNGEQTRAKEYMGLKNSIVAFGFARRRGESEYNLMKEVHSKILSIRVWGAACFSLSMVARGKIDACFLGNSKIWDIEPGLLACKEAGAKIYRNDLFTIVTNNEEIMQLILNTAKITFKDNL